MDEFTLVFALGHEYRLDIFDGFGKGRAQQHADVATDGFVKGVAISFGGAAAPINDSILHIAHENSFTRQIEHFHQIEWQRSRDAILHTAQHDRQHTCLRLVCGHALHGSGAEDFNFMFARRQHGQHNDGDAGTGFTQIRQQREMRGR